MLDYLEAGSLIINRLKERLPDIRVAATWGLAKIDETKDTTPYLMVFLESDLPGESTPSGCDHKVEQRWSVIIAVREADDDPGLLISRTIAALAGWRPGGRFSAIKRVASSHIPDWTPSGVFYFPLAFASGFVFNVEP